MYLSFSSQTDLKKVDIFILYEEIMEGQLCYHVKNLVKDTHVFTFIYSYVQFKTAKTCKSRKHPLHDMTGKLTNPITY